MNLTATGKRYIIQAQELNQATASGIIIKQSDNTQFGIICAAGAQVSDPLPIGTKIVVLWSAAVLLRHENCNYHLVDENAVIAVVESE